MLLTLDEKETISKKTYFSYIVFSFFFGGETKRLSSFFFNEIV